jgi:hypothetical protein
LKKPSTAKTVKNIRKDREESLKENKRKGKNFAGGLGFLCVLCEALATFAVKSVCSPARTYSFSPRPPVQKSPIGKPDEEIQRSGTQRA